MATRTKPTNDGVADVAPDGLDGVDDLGIGADTSPEPVMQSKPATALTRPSSSTRASWGLGDGQAEMDRRLLEMKTIWHPIGR